MRRFVAGALIALSWAVAADAVSAAPSAQQWSFSGDCSFTGAVRFSPSLTSTPRQGRGTATAAGTCTGTLTAPGKTRHVTSAKARYWATDTSAQMDCQGGPATGHGRLHIGQVTLPFQLTETRAAAAAFLQLTSPRWSAIGAAHTGASADPVAVLQACAGSGLRTAPLEVDLHA